MFSFGVTVLIAIHLTLSIGHPETRLPGEIEYEKHGERIWQTLTNPQSLFIEDRILSPDAFEEKIYTGVSVDEDKDFRSLSPIEAINQTFQSIFSTPRNAKYNQQLKDKAVQAIQRTYTKLGLKPQIHAFVDKRRNLAGRNIFAILPGRNYGNPSQDKFIVVGAHYDTVPKTAGIDDNASGSVVIVELARRVAHLKGKLNHSIVFVNFDLEEAGLLGSYAFARSVVIDKLIRQEKRKYLGTYAIDMTLNYDPRPNSQTVPRDIRNDMPQAVKQIAKNKNRGDFLNIWSRRGIDNKLVDAIKSKATNSKYPVIDFDVPLPADRPDHMSTLTRSDHASFWYHNHPEYKETLNAVLLTDLGVWRGEKGPKCYHQPCDDVKWLTEENLLFLKNTLDTLEKVVTGKLD